MMHGQKKGQYIRDILFRK